MAVKCVMCESELTYEPEYCCDGDMCGCQGLPIAPPVCSNECADAFMAVYEAAFVRANICPTKECNGISSSNEEPLCTNCTYWRDHRG